MSRRGVAGLSAAVTLGMVVATIMPFLVGALGPLLVERFAVTRSQLGLVPTVHFSVAMVASAALGRLVDVVGARRVLRGLCVLSAGVITAVAWAPSFVLLAAAVAFAGVGQALGNPSTNALIAEHVDEGARGVVVGLKQSGVQGATVIAGVVAAGVPLVGWPTAVQLLVVLPVIVFVIAGRAIPRGHVRRGERDIVAVGSTGAVVWLTVYAFFMGNAMAAVSTYLPLYAHEEFAMSPAAAGATVAVAGVVGVVSRIAWAYFSDRFEDTALALAVLSVVAALAVGIVASASLAGTSLLWLGVVLLGGSAMAWNAVAMLAVVKYPGHRGTGWASGMVGTGFFAGFILSPPAFGVVVDHTGTYHTAWLMVAAMALCAAAVAVAWRWRSRGEGTGVGRGRP